MRAGGAPGQWGLLTSCTGPSLDPRGDPELLGTLPSPPQLCRASLPTTPLLTPGVPQNLRRPPLFWGTQARSLLGCSNRPAICPALTESPLVRACGPRVGAAARGASGCPPCPHGKVPG